MRLLLRGVLLALLLLGAAQPDAHAEDADSAATERPEWAEDGRNKIAIFAGVTFLPDETGPALGIDYEYRFTRRFGLGATVEYTSAEVREGVLVVSFGWHVWREFKVFLAPGLEIDTEDGTDSFLVRLGVEYGFDIGKGWEVAPTLIYDFTSDDNAIVIGAGFAKSF